MNRCMCVDTVTEQFYRNPDVHLEILMSKLEATVSRKKDDMRKK